MSANQLLTVLAFTYSRSVLGLFSPAHVTDHLLEQLVFLCALDSPVEDPRAILRMITVTCVTLELDSILYIVRQNDCIEEYSATHLSRGRRLRIQLNGHNSPLMRTLQHFREHLFLGL